MILAVFSIVILIGSVIIHEVAHGYAALALGDPTAKLQGRLTLNPIAHIDPMGSIVVPALLALSHTGFMFGWAKPVPYNPYNLTGGRFHISQPLSEAIVAAAGVTTNLLLAVLFAVLARVLLASGLTEAGVLAALVVSVNLSLGLFNLIPLPPLDGYGILTNLLPGRASAMLRSFESRIRQGGALSLILVLALFSFFLAAPFDALLTYLFKLLVG